MNFEFPDIASHPEIACAVNPSHGNSYNIAGPETIRALKKRAARFAVFDDQENSIAEAQLNRVVTAWDLFTKLHPRGESEMTADGIAHRLVDTGKLEIACRDDIRTLIDSPPRTGLTDYDRARDRSDLSAEVHTILSNSGLLDAVKQYKQANVAVNKVTLHVSLPGDRHHYQTFQDTKTVPKLLNLHMDPKPGVLKALIYLGEVGPDNGPFEFIKGSNHWTIDPVERVFAWGNSVGNYCHTPRHRRVACAFPKRFRKNAIVGRLIQDGTELGNFLLQAITAYTSDFANVVVFDPCFGFHRGGLCKEGIRANLQVILR